jgi:dihydrofolate synthase / folylpolyglutamate synthase
MTYGEAVARILGLRGGEMAGMRPGLARIEAFLEALGNPERSVRIAQVGGTNGKGSIAAMLAAILTAAGLRTGLYTSPHLCSFRERIRVDGRAISEDDVTDGVEAIGTLVARLDATMFEAATALALDHFARESVEVAVLEVGLGGRLDATTVGKPEVEVIGQIDLDHQAVLGSTLAEIAAEKAAIIRSGVALSARQAPAAEAVLAARAREAGIPLLLEGRDLTVATRGFDLSGQRLDLAGPGWSYPETRCALLGVYQPGNALLAAAAARCFGADEPAVRAGLGAARWPGRFQIIQQDPAVVVDGAHNPAGARALAASLRAYFPGQPVTFVVGAYADKDQAGILEALRPLAARFVVTRAPSARSAAPEALAALLAPYASDLPYGVDIAPSPAEALALATSPARTPVICVAGSLLLVGAILADRAPTLDLV